MKKKVFFSLYLVLLSLIAFNFHKSAEVKANNSNNQATPLQTFISCLSTSEINVKSINADNIEVNVSATGKTEINKVKDCISIYDNSRINSPESPAIFLITNVDKKNKSK